MAALGAKIERQEGSITIEGGALSDGGNLHAWLVRTLADVDTAQIQDRPPAAHGVRFLPFLGGERSLGRPFRFASYAAAHAKNTPTGGASTAVAVSLSGRYFATSPRSGVVTLWRANNLHKVGELRGPRGFVEALAFSHDDRKLAAVLKSGATGRTLVWQLASHTLIRKLGSSRQAVPNGVAFSPDDQLLATAGLDGLARVYRLHNGRLIGSDQLNGSLVNVDFSPDGRFLAAASLSGQIDIWNIGRRTVTQKIEHGRAVFSLSFLPDSAGGGASVSAVATNLTAAPSKPFRLTFEVLDVAGQVIATLTQDVPALPPRQSQAFDLSVNGKGVTGWRYRAS